MCVVNRNKIGVSANAMNDESGEEKKQRKKTRARDVSPVSLGVNKVPDIHTVYKRSGSRDMT